MRLCQRIGCENSIDHLRADAHYCGRTCKREATRARALSHEPSPSGGFWHRYTLIRRPRRSSAAVTAILAVLLTLLVGAGAAVAATTSTTQTTTTAATSSSTVPAGLPTGACTGSRYAMQCAFNAPGQQTRPLASAFSLFGVDTYGAGNPGIAATFDCSYESGSPGGKDWTSSGIHGWTGRGKKTCVVWETYANRAEYGCGAGHDDAFRARAEAAQLGFPAYVPIRFAVDTDTSSAAVRPYFQCAKQVLLNRTGVYGSYRVVVGLEAAGITTPATDWQTLAWSFGSRSRACLYQSSINRVLDGASVDFDQATCPNFGQYPYTPPAPRIVCFGKHAQGNATCRKVHASIRKYQGASSSSGRAYKKRGCVALVSLRNKLNARWDFFWNHTHVKRLEVKAKQASRQRALTATGHAVNGVRRTITGRECLTFSSRVAYFNAKIETTEKRYGS